MAQNLHSRALVVVFLVSIAWANSALAQQSPRLQIATDGSLDTPIELGIADLDAMPQSEFTTSTIWTNGEVRFSGVPLKRLLDSFGVVGSRLEMTALNDYAVTMELADLEGDVPIVATRMNGETIPVRNKGPYWVVFPYDRDAKYRSETIYSISIWQLNRLRILD